MSILAPFTTRVKTNLDEVLQMTQMINGIMMTGDNRANQIIVELYNSNGRVYLDPAPFSAGTSKVIGYFIRGDGYTVEVDGTVNEQGEPVVVIPSAVYLSTGALSIAIRILDDKTIVTDPETHMQTIEWGSKTVVAALSCFVQNTETNSIVDPSHKIPDVQELLAYIDNLQEQYAEVSQAEGLRVIAEQGRVTAENGRVATEQGRVTAENNRVTAEQGRATAETNREAAEVTRNNTLNTAVAKINNMSVDAHKLRYNLDPTVTISEDPIDGHKHISFGLVSGKDFHIAKTFASVAQMNAYSGSDLTEFDFAMIDTGSVEDPDTGKLYCYEPSKTPKWSYIGDLSGAQGIKGETGTGIDHIVLNADYTLTVFMDNSTSYTTASIRGERGETGEPGVYYGTQEPTNPDIKVWIDPSGNNFIEEIDDWLEDHITNPDSPPLDRTLTSAVSAAPADIVGDIHDTVANIINNSDSPYDYKSAVSGNVVEVYDAVDSAVKQMQIEIAPVQDLHGYDKPWVGGAGKNLFDAANATISSGYAGGITMTKNDDGSITLSGTANATPCLIYAHLSSPIPANTNVTISLNNSTTNTEVGVRLSDGRSYFGMGIYADEQNKTGVVAMTREASDINVFVKSNHGDVEPITLKIQCELGNTATPWSPYENICPISGFTGCDVVRTGSYYDVSVYNGYITTDGRVSSSTAGSKTVYAKVNKGSITIRKKLSSTFRVGLFTIIPTAQVYSTFFETVDASKTEYTINVPEDCYIAAFIVNSSSESDLADSDNIVESVDIINDYEAYSITFPDGRTVYSGTLTVNADGTGTLVVDKILDDNLKARTWTMETTSNGNVFSCNAITWKAENSNYICNKYNAVAKARTAIVNGEIGTYNTSNAMKRFSICDNAYSTVADFVASLNDLEVCCEVENPQSYTLTAPQIRTILGYNRIYASTGSILSMLYPAEKYQTAEQAEKERIHAVVDESSAVVSITDGADNVPMGMQIAIEPVQDKHGLEPYPPGGGKNLAKLSDTIIGSNQKSTVTYSDSGATITATGTYARYGWLIPVTIGETYIISFLGKASSDGSGMNPKAYFGSADGAWSSSEAGYLTNVGIPTTASMRSFSFTASSNVLFFGIYVTSTATSGSIEISNVQLELGSTATDYAPYSNICPITGWTGVEISQTGKNLVYDSLANANIDGSGEIFVLSSNTSSLCFAQVSEGVTYTVNRSATTLVAYFAEAPGDGSRSYDRTNHYINDTFTSPITGYVAVRVPAAEVDTFQIEIGTESSAFEPYIKNTYQIEFPSSAGTVYGGSLTINKDGTGSLVVDRAIEEVPTLSEVTTSSFGVTYGTFLAQKVPSTSKTEIVVEFENAKGVSYNDRGQMSYVGYCNTTTTYKQMLLRAGEGTTLEQFNAMYAGSRYVYKLATPTTYTLPAPVIRSLLGVNNVWASTGNVLRLDYTADTKSYIEGSATDRIMGFVDNRVSMAVDEPLTEICPDYCWEGETYTEALPVGKIVNYKPNHAPWRLLRITTEIPAGGTIIQGTNAELVSITGLLAELIPATGVSF